MLEVLFKNSHSENWNPINITSAFTSDAKILIYSLNNILQHFTSGLVSVKEKIFCRKKEAENSLDICVLRSSKYRLLTCNYLNIAIRKVTYLIQGWYTSFLSKYGQETCSRPRWQVTLRLHSISSFTLYNTIVWVLVMEY